MSTTTATSILPDNFFDDLDIPEAEKEFVVNRRKEIYNGLQQLARKRVVEEISTNIPAMTIETSPKKVAKTGKTEKTGKTGKTAKTGKTKSPKKADANGSSSSIRDHKSVPEKAVRARKPRQAPAIHLRCVARKKSAKKDEEDHCMGHNKLQKTAEPKHALEAFSKNGTPSALLFCGKHTNEDAIVEGIQETIRSLIKEPIVENDEESDSDEESGNNE